MIFQEPKIEYVAIDMANIIATSGGTGSGENCIGPNARSNNCGADFMD